MKLVYVVGTRPNFMKVAAVMSAVDRWNSDHRDGAGIGQTLVHTGQHYDETMSQVFFDDLALPRPDHHLCVGSGSHAEQTARMMLALEPVLIHEAPELVVTVGDVNSTLAAALVSSKLGIATAHVEAGLRSNDRTMPEELNRRVVDQLSDLLFTTSRDAITNLRAEGVLPERIYFVGNTMIDTLEAHLLQARQSPILRILGLDGAGYAVVTLHRPSNVDERLGLERLVELVATTAERLPVVFPVHARTRERLSRYGLHDGLRANDAVRLCHPLGYLDFLCLLADARLVLTDSGGIQEETTVLGVPCLTLRKNTERPITIWQGTNRLVDPDDLQAAIDAVDAALSAPMPKGRTPELWDGHAGDRIVRVVAEWIRSEP